MVEIAEIAAAAVKFLTPYLPFLKGVSDEVQKTIAKDVVEKAKKVWGSIINRLHGKDISRKEFENAATQVIEFAGKQRYETQFVEVLAEILQGDPELVEELRDLLGGDKAVQEIIAGNDAIIDDNHQEMGMAGTQRMEIKGDGGRISGNTQKMGS